jgi:RNA polymerase sigma-70 factor (ECF subfamily)
MQNNAIIEFTLIYNRHKEPLFNYALKVVKSKMFAEDIVHDVFLKLYDNLARIRDRARVEAWIFTTARNEIFSHYRKKINKYDQDFSLCGEQQSRENFTDNFEQRELIDVIESELNIMDPAQSEVFYLKEYSGLSYKEIAQIMDITEDLVKSRIFKVRQKLKKVLTNLEKDLS